MHHYLLGRETQPITILKIKTQKYCHDKINKQSKYLGATELQGLKVELVNNIWKIHRRWIYINQYLDHFYHWVSHIQIFRQ